MINYTTDEKIQGIIENNEKLIMVFGKGDQCSVCNAVENRVNTQLTKKYPELEVHYVQVDDSPSFRGQHLVFAVPTLILFDGDKEIHRESQIVDFTRLERLLHIYFS